MPNNLEDFKIIVIEEIGNIIPERLMNVHRNFDIFTVIKK